MDLRKKLKSHTKQDLVTVLAGIYDARYYDEVKDSYDLDKDPDADEFLEEATRLFEDSCLAP